MRTLCLPFLLLLTIMSMCSCSDKRQLTSYEDYPIRTGDLTEMVYSPTSTAFTVWAPTAEEVKLLLFDSGDAGHPYQTYSMKSDPKEGTWNYVVDGDIEGKFYAFNVKVAGKWLGDTPGINARAVGVNGKRAAVVDMAKTNPEGWAQDKGPVVKSPADIVLYEMHHRDMSVSPTTNNEYRGKYLAMTEKGTTNKDGLSTGVDHLKELGVTHIHILPSYDYASVDESKLENNQYNWGYDPQNYNVPDGSYSTNPFEPTVRIKEFKEMVQSLHNEGIGVVLDVVYNHTFNTEDSNFERTVPGYFYRHKEDGSLANGSGCGNETASDREMMRKYMIESVLYWMNEYHIDGFRFDLMGIHDIETMNQIQAAAKAVNPSVFIYGEGWAAEAPIYPADSLAMKANAAQMPGIAVFSDEMRDGLRGPFNDDKKGAFLAGLPGNEESIKYGIVGAIEHPQVVMDSVNYSSTAWADEPTQMISYVSCHDDMSVVDRLKATIPNITPEEIARLDKLAQTVVFTSQGVPFIYAGEEILRDKKGVHNSYQSPDSINQIDWDRKSTNHDVFVYYKNLIDLRKSHPAFRMADADMVREHLQFLPVEGDNLIAYQLTGNANGDSWKDIIVAFNGRDVAAPLTVPAGKYTIVARDGKIDKRGMGSITGPNVMVPAQSALIIYKQ